MRLKFLGSGDAFGSGGRFNTCFLLDRGAESVLIDCGATAMVALRKFEVDPNAIAAIVLSHLHGDHFGGLPFFILDGQLVSRRTKPLVIAGPAGTSARLLALMEASYPGAAAMERKFEVEFVELAPGVSTPVVPNVSVTAALVAHPSGGPSLALRMTCDGRVIAFTGDTEWVDSLITVGRDADLLISECYTYDRKVRYHLNYATLREKLPLIGAKRVVLTHMAADMLQRSAEIAGVEVAHDGLELTLA